MMRRLKPTAVIMYGTVPEGCTGNIIPVKAFQAQMRERVKLHSDTVRIVLDCPELAAAIRNIDISLVKNILQKQ